MLLSYSPFFFFSPSPAHQLSGLPIRGLGIWAPHLRHCGQISLARLVPILKEGKVRQKPRQLGALQGRPGVTEPGRRLRVQLNSSVRGWGGALRCRRREACPGCLHERHGWGQILSGLPLSCALSPLDPAELLATQMRSSGAHPSCCACVCRSSRHTA